MAISLQKGQVVSLVKADGSQLRLVRMGLSWKPIGSSPKPVKKGFFGKLRGGSDSDDREISVDLDASCIIFDSGGHELETVYYGHLHSNDGSINHTGDDLTGRAGSMGGSDNESIIVELARVNSQAATLMFTVNSFSGQAFELVDTATCRLVDEAAKTEIGSFALNGHGKHTGILMAKLTRSAGGWIATMLGITCDGRTAHDLASVAKHHL